MSSTTFVDQVTPVLASWLNDVNTTNYTTVPTLVSYKATLQSTAGATNVGFIQSGTGAVTRTVASELLERISLKGYGAVGDGVTYDDVAVNAWITYLLSSGKAGFVPNGRYRMANRFLVDLYLSINANKTFKIYGEGAYNSIFFIESTVSPALNFYKSNVSNPTGTYLSIEDIGFQFNTPNDCAALGLSNFTDNIGNANLKNVYFGNNNTTNGTGAVLQLNYLFDSVFTNVVSVGKVGYGVALQCRQAQFCQFLGGSYSNSSKNIQFIGGTNQGLAFVGVDSENCDYIVSNESVATNHVLFSGGFWDCYRPDLVAAGINCITTTVGGKGCIVFDNIVPARPAMLPYSGAFFNANAVDNNGRVQLRGYYTPATPAMPGNGVTINNATGQTQHVTVHGGTVSSMFIRGVNTGLTSGSFVLTPGDYIAIQYSVAPTWEWYPLF